MCDKKQFEKNKGTFLVKIVETKEVVFSMVRLFRGKTPKIKDDKGNVIPTSIASLERVTLGGVKQWLLIRSHNVDNPILLFLHGGPGSSEMGFAHKFERNLEKHFLIVNWDQRGTGKSFSRRIPKESMTIEQFVADAHELILNLRERFRKEKVILVGHSWGTVLGVLLAQKYPELIAAYVGIGQVVNITENERISHQFTLQQAKLENNKKAIRQLMKVEPPYTNNLRQLNIQRKWLGKYGGVLYGQKSMWPLLKIMFQAPEYTVRDVIKFLMGTMFSIISLFEKIVNEIDFLKTATKLAVPVYIISGKYDYNTPFELAEKYYQKLQAPKKEFIWFEKSAHSPNYEETEKFDEVMIEKVLKEMK